MRNKALLFCSPPPEGQFQRNASRIFMKLVVSNAPAATLEV